MDYKSFSKEELIKLSKDWCDAYESGNPVVSDEEYDDLVQYLNTENTATIGSESHSDTYTVKHSFIMGSLAKVHAIKNDETGEINYSHPVYDVAPKNVVMLKEVNNVLSKANNAHFAEFSPKLDGNSFSLTVQLTPTGDSTMMTCATRGDGQYGVNILAHFLASNSYEKYFTMLEDAAKDLLRSEYDTLVIRGEAIVRNSVYDKKYADKFSNPRVFVSGTLNREFDEADKNHSEHLDACRDIDYVCYDYRLVDSETQNYKELSWMNMMDESYSLIKPYLNKIGQLPDEMGRIIINISNSPLTASNIEVAYKYFEEVRHASDYALDGIVVKPECEARQKNLNRHRPLDMIAIKFVPEKMHSVITDIVWTVAQNGECYPKGIIAPVKYDGKEITRVGLHGYSYLLENKCGIGSEVEMVMNGDIVPGVYKVLSEGTLKMPEYNTYVSTVGDNDTLHLFREFSVEDKQRHLFCASAKALQVDGIKSKTAEKIWDMCHECYEWKMGEPLINLMQLMYHAIDGNIIYPCMSDGKAIQNIVSALEKYSKSMKLGDVIRGLCIEDCGAVTSEVCANIISGIDYDVTGLNESAYSWALDAESENYKRVKNISETLNIKMKESEVKSVNADSVEAYVILTGSPKSAGYPTKSEWLAAHPQYVETTKWNECTLLVTNDIESGTGKMAKAAKLGIPVRTYFD